jgi:small neutral amino acid transporter SnatA (MarC family)
VSAIPSAFGSHKLKLSPTGKVFPLTPENLKRWRIWWKYVVVDQVWLWAVGCFVGMFLNINLATAIIAAGTDIAQIGAGAYQGNYMAEHLWKGLWFLGLLNGFWILFSTHLGNTDMLIRVVTDVVWMANSEARGWTAATAAKIYYVLLVVFTAWGLLAVNWGHAMDLFKVLGNVSLATIDDGSTRRYVRVAA